MKRCKKFFKIFTIIFIITILSSCKKDEKLNFPLSEKGYVKKDVVLVNGLEYELEGIEEYYKNSQIQYDIEVKLEENKRISVILPQRTPVHLWFLEENQDINFISYDKLSLAVNESEIPEGESNVLQKFEFETSFVKMGQVSLKWSNVNEMGKSFADKKADYTLNIRLIK